MKDNPIHKFRQELYDMTKLHIELTKLEDKRLRDISKPIDNRYHIKSLAFNALSSSTDFNKLDITYKV